jgi:GNAT superfamily N-acetyltransferase
VIPAVEVVPIDAEEASRFLGDGEGGLWVESEGLLLQTTSKALGLFVDGKMVGAATLWLYDKDASDRDVWGYETCEVTALGILPEYRKRGLSEMLVRAALDECKRSGSTKLGAWPVTEGMAAQVGIPRGGFSTRPLIANVRKKAWVEQLLTKRDKIEKAIGMPLGTMLGCGHWGCVFESTPPWVVKLSIDPTEGPIWSKIKGLLDEERYGDGGFPEIKSIHRITPDLVTGGRKRKVWAIVRENVEPVFKEYKARELGLHGGGTVLRTSPYTTEKLGLHAPVGAYDFQRPRGEVADAAVMLGLRRPSPPAELSAWTPQQEDFGRAIDGLMKYKEAATAWHTLRSPARTHGQIKTQSYYRAQFGCGGPSQDRDCLEKIEYRLNRIVETMFHGPACAPLGESLSMLASNGVYLRDVHLLNIGWHVARDADDWDRIVIFDPGHTPTKSTGGIEEALVENPAGTFTLYHGTYTRFDRPTEIRAPRAGTDYGPGLYMTTDPREAAGYGDYVYAATVKLEKPLDLLDDEPEALKKLQRGLKITDEDLEHADNKTLEALRLANLVYSQSAISKFLMRLGYDSIYVDHSLVEHPATAVASNYISVLSPSQILSWDLLSREAP